MSFTHLSNMARGKDFVNKLVKLSHDLICKILISPPSYNSCGQNNFGEICFIYLIFIYPVCICATQAALFHIIFICDQSFCITRHTHVMFPIMQ
jgi:hypothetical protein